jgi:hypothetical protein
MSRDHCQPASPPPRPVERLRHEADLFGERYAGGLGGNTTFVQHPASYRLVSCAHRNNANPTLSYGFGIGLNERARGALNATNSSCVGRQHKNPRLCWAKAIAADRSPSVTRVEPARGRPLRAPR